MKLSPVSRRGKETPADRRKRAMKILAALYRTYPDSTTALRHTDALELLVATILSAQCTDERVNRVTEGLFRKYRTAQDYAKADPKVFEQEIRSTGFYRNKAKNVLGMAKMLVERFDGRVPDTMEQLVELPGVARKTANVVLGTWFKKASGIVVDTHVHRVAQRLGFSRQADPNKVEQDLMPLIPRDDWIQFGHMMVWHGRRICTARKPDCPGCPLNAWCPSAGKVG